MPDLLHSFLADSSCGDLQDEMYDLDTKPARIQVKAREEVSQDVCHGLNCQSPCAALAVRSATTVATVGDMRDVAEEAFGWEANGPIRCDNRI